MEVPTGTSFVWLELIWEWRGKGSQLTAFLVSPSCVLRTNCGKFIGAYTSPAKERQMLSSNIRGGFKTTSAALLLGMAGAFVGTSASAGISTSGVYAFEEDAGSGFTSAPNNEVGDLAFVESMYNANTGKFDWKVGFNTNGDGELPEGFVLAVNDGPVPKGHTGYLTALYFDATDPNNPIVTAYGYNGDNSATSHQYGTPNWVYDAGSDTWSPPTDAPDRIASSLNAATSAFLNSATVDTSGSEADVVFSLSIDSNILNSHTPLYPNTGPGYLGIAYSTSIGVWQHPFVDFNAQYNGDGYLTSWEFDQSTYGWFDFTGGTAIEVPEPVAALLAPAALFLLRRRQA